MISRNRAVLPRECFSAIPRRLCLGAGLIVLVTVACARSPSGPADGGTGAAGTGSGGATGSTGGTGGPSTSSGGMSASGGAPASGGASGTAPTGGMTGNSTGGASASGGNNVGGVAPGSGGSAGRSGSGGGAAAGMGGTLGPVNATVTVDTATRLQTMEGFGGALAFYVNYLSEHPNRSEIYDLIFRDLGLDILRVGNWYQTLTVDEPTVAVVTAAATSLGHAPRLLMSSWSPAASLKSNNDTKNGGTLIQQNGAYNYDGFAQWWGNALQAYAARGVRPDFISIQNEPDYKASWETCLFGPSEGVDSGNGGVNVAGYDKALDAVYARVQTLSPVPQLLGPEVSGLISNKVQNYLAKMNSAHFAGVAHHLYSGGTPSTPDTFNTSLQAVATAAGAKPRFMTEYAPEARDMFTTAWLINNAVTVEGVTAYIYWDLTWDVPNGLVATETPYDKSKWTTTKGYVVHDTYYALKHFSRWVDTGWTRVSAMSSAGAVKTSAFISPDGSSVTVVVLNTGATTQNVAVATGAWTPLTSAVYRTSGTTERASPVGQLATGGVLALPALGIATVTLAR